MRISWRRWLLFAGIGMLILLTVGPAVPLAELALQRPKPRPEIIPYDAARVRIVAKDGIALVGAYEEAAQVSRRCVVILHGVGSRRQDMPGLRADFRAMGYNVLLPDGRGHGESGGAHVTYGVLERGDVHRWVEFLEKRDCSEGIYALGLSMGAAVVIESLEDETRIRAAAAESSFSSFEAIAEDRVHQMIPALGMLAQPIVALGFGYARLRYGVKLWEASPAAAAPKIQVPVLLIHGTEDTNIDPKHSRALLPLFARAELWMVPGARHVGCYGRDSVAYMRRVTRWFDAAALGR